MLCPLPPSVQLPAQTRLPSAGAALKEGEHRGQRKTKEKSTERVEKKKSLHFDALCIFGFLGAIIAVFFLKTTHVNRVVKTAQSG